MTKSHPWIVPHDGTGPQPYALECRRCGAVQEFRLPMAVTYWCAVAKLFERDHANCREPRAAVEATDNTTPSLSIGSPFLLPDGRYGTVVATSHESEWDVETDEHLPTVVRYLVRISDEYEWRELPADLNMERT